MFVPFESLPPSSRVWIYQSNKLFTSEARDILSEALQSFTQTWTAHGNPMKASFQLPYDHFLVMAADEKSASASGCSIDGSVRTIKTVADQLGLDFFDRKNIAFLKGNTVGLISLNDLKASSVRGEWGMDSLTFNNLVTSKEGLSDWLVPAGTTWLKRYLSPDAVSK